MNTTSKIDQLESDLDRYFDDLHRLEIIQDQICDRVTDLMANNIEYCAFSINNMHEPLSNMPDHISRRFGQHLRECDFERAGMLMHAYLYDYQHKIVSEIVSADFN